MGVKLAAIVTALIAASPAVAQDRELCADRPGLDTPPCTVEPGRVVVETGLADWTVDRDADGRTDTMLFGETLVRIGVADPLELQFGWTPFGHQRMHDRAAGTIFRTDRVGDALVGAKLNLLRPDGSKTSVAIETQVTVPVGRSPIGQGDWGLTNVVPLSFELSDGVALQASPEVDAAVNESGHGRHLSWGNTAGIAVDLTDQLTAALEGQVIRDDDPAGHETHALAGLSLAWKRGRNLQFDVGANAGLNRNSDDFELYAGISRRF